MSKYFITTSKYNQIEHYDDKIIGKYELDPAIRSNKVFMVDIKNKPNKVCNQSPVMQKPIDQTYILHYGFNFIKGEVLNKSEIDAFIKVLSDQLVLDSQNCIINTDSNTILNLPEDNSFKTLDEAINYATLLNNYSIGIYYSQSLKEWYLIKNIEMMASGKNLRYDEDSILYLRDDVDVFPEEESKVNIFASSQQNVQSSKIKPSVDYIFNSVSFPIFLFLVLITLIWGYGYYKNYTSNKIRIEYDIEE